MALYKDNEYKVTEKGYNAARHICSKLSSQSMRKRAFKALICLDTLADYLYSQGYKIDISKNLYKIPKINEEYEFTDLYYNGKFLDILPVVNGKYIFIPKIHFANGVVPDLYVAADYSQTSKKVRFLGCIESKNIDKHNQNDKYFIMETDSLESPDNIENFISTIKVSDLTENNHDIFYSFFLDYLDGILEKGNKERLILHLTECKDCRDTLIEFFDYEIIAKQTNKYPDIFADYTLDIVGASSINDDKYKNFEEVTLEIDKEKDENEDDDIDESSQNNEKFIKSAIEDPLQILYGKGKNREIFEILNSNNKKSSKSILNGILDNVSKENNQINKNINENKTTSTNKGVINPEYYTEDLSEGYYDLVSNKTSENTDEQFKNNNDNKTIESDNNELEIQEPIKENTHTQINEEREIKTNASGVPLYLEDAIFSNTNSEVLSIPDEPFFKEELHSESSGTMSTQDEMLLLDEPYDVDSPLFLNEKDNENNNDDILSDIFVEDNLSNQNHNEISGQNSSDELIYLDNSLDNDNIQNDINYEKDIKSDFIPESLVVQEEDLIYGNENQDINIDFSEKIEESDDIFSDEELIHFNAEDIDIVDDTDEEYFGKIEHQNYPNIESDNNNENIKIINNEDLLLASAQTSIVPNVSETEQSNIISELSSENDDDVLIFNDDNDTLLLQEDTKVVSSNNLDDENKTLMIDDNEVDDNIYDNKSPEKLTFDDEDDDLFLTEDETIVADNNKSNNFTEDEDDILILNDDNDDLPLTKNTNELSKRQLSDENEMLIIDDSNSDDLSLPTTSEDDLLVFNDDSEELLLTEDTNEISKNNISKDQNETLIIDDSENDDNIYDNKSSEKLTFDNEEELQLEGNEEDLYLKSDYQLADVQKEDSNDEDLLYYDGESINNEPVQTTTSGNYIENDFQYKEEDEEIFNNDDNEDEDSLLILDDNNEETEFVRPASLQFEDDFVRPASLQMEEYSNEQDILTENDNNDTLTSSNDEDDFYIEENVDNDNVIEPIEDTTNIEDDSNIQNNEEIKTPEPKKKSQLDIVLESMSSKEKNEIYKKQKENDNKIINSEIDNESTVEIDNDDIEDVVYKDVEDPKVEKEQEKTQPPKKTIFREFKDAIAAKEEAVESGRIDIKAQKNSDINEPLINASEDEYVEEYKDEYDDEDTIEDVQDNNDEQAIKNEEIAESDDNNEEYEDDDEEYEEVEEDEDNKKKKIIKIGIIVAVILVIIGAGFGVKTILFKGNNDTNAQLEQEANNQNEEESNNEDIGAQSLEETEEEGLSLPAQTAEGEQVNENTQEQNDNENITQEQMNPKAGTENATTEDMNKAVTNAFSDTPSSIIIHKLSWGVNATLAGDTSIKSYLQTAGKIIKADLQKNINKVKGDVALNPTKVQIKINDSGTTDVIITKSSGSEEVDNVVLQSVKQSISTCPLPEISEETRNANEKATNERIIKLTLTVSF